MGAPGHRFAVIASRAGGEGVRRHDWRAMTANLWPGTRDTGSPLEPGGADGHFRQHDLPGRLDHVALEDNSIRLSVVPDAAGAFSGVRLQGTPCE